MDLKPTNKSAAELCIENGWTCRSQYDLSRVTQHKALHWIEGKIIVFGNEQFFVDVHFCEHCRLKLEIVRPPKPVESPELDHAERCARCNHLKHQHYHTTEGPDNKRVWVRLWCQYVGYNHDPDNSCTCKRYVAPKAGSGVSLLPSAEVEDVTRHA